MQPSTQINRKHVLDDRYFDRIDTQEKAYWLGFLWADGSINRTAERASGPNRLRITQKWTERDHLELFRDTLGSDYRLVRVLHAGGHDTAQLDVNCRPLCESLQKLGYGPKDVRVHVPDIPQDLTRHFMRGYFDGDGCLSVYTQKTGKYVINRQEWSLTGNGALMAEMKSLLEREAETTPTVALKPYKRSPMTKSLRYGKKADIGRLYEYLYKDASVYLNSKHEKFVEFFARCAS